MKRNLLQLKAKKASKVDTSIGFLGGGQLARMLALAAHPLGMTPKALVSSQKDPACPVVQDFQVGDLNQAADIENFLGSVELATFESEFINASLFADLEKKTDCYIFPKPSVMKLMQNRLSQKQLLNQYKIPTSPHIEVAQRSDLDKAWQQLRGAFVLKAGFGGYDGYGTFYAHKQSDLGVLAQQISDDSQKFIAEKFVKFKRELACIFVRSRDGSITHLPLVETRQHQSRCDWVLGPVKHSQFAATAKKIFAMMRSLDFVGALGVEFFDTGKNLLVNELAPRVHNSGHYSQNALDFSQFELHLLAGLGEKLPTPQALSKAFVMVNLIGESTNAMEIPENLKGKLHWYGKAENRKGRKMGHINYVGNDGKKLLAFALKERKRIRR